MAPPPITEDYYLVLEVKQSDAMGIITSSYRRLALKLHPDRNITTTAAAAEAFQRLGRAYETLSDISKRRDYDVIYPSITRSQPGGSRTQAPRPPPAPTPQSEADSEALQIATLHKSKQERAARWQTKKTTLVASMRELQRTIASLEQEIKNLNSISAAEAAVEARKNSWGTWLVSPLFKKGEESEEEKARKGVKIQERKMEKDMKERRIESRKADLRRGKALYDAAKAEIDAADRCEDAKIQAIQAKGRAREDRERAAKARSEAEWLAKICKQQREQQEERERVERERLTRIWRQQEEQRMEQQRADQAAAERYAAQCAQQEEDRRRRQKIINDEAQRRRDFDSRYGGTQSNIYNTHGFAEHSYSSSRKIDRSDCLHDVWWDKAQGRMQCPECSDVWMYMLECPKCSMKACPKCQSSIRGRIPRGSARLRSPSPVYHYDYSDY
ncbi:hypothetical protein LTR56_014655 [Elasticomyces elasticus]|nr:hypothetical protein LTR56_014655 [Elasticomyces elasticus]KAK3645332.1 hypothetical protein LTR22_014797 [Elasticomyces elasticus]KAK4919827.1 hypothetical protein LTR49_012574 [Elasticomyces elasticus]KAK5750103.1 hypothetical protein LTS12_019829 [Elasticomyces elasticus]